MTDNHKRLEQAADTANQLLADDKTISVISVVMLASWQMYAAARHQLTSRLARLPEADDPEAVEQILVESMRSKSTEGFDTKDLLERIEQTCIPFVRILSHMVEDERDLQYDQHLISAERERRTLPLEIGFPVSEQQPRMPRSPSTILVGPDAAVQHVLGKAVMAAKSAPPVEGGMFVQNVVWLSTHDAAYNDQRLIVIPRKKWEGIAESRRKLEELLDPALRTFDNRVDLLVVGDLQAAVHRPPRGSAAVAVSRAHVRMRGWARDVGAGLLGGAPGLHLEAADMRRMADFANVLEVSTEPIDDTDEVGYAQSRVRIGAGLHEFNAPTELVEDNEQ